jgi:hypothetical protein
MPPVMNIDEQPVMSLDLTESGHIECIEQLHYAIIESMSLVSIDLQLYVLCNPKMCSINLHHGKRRLHLILALKHVLSSV